MSSAKCFLRKQENKQETLDISSSEKRSSVARPEAGPDESRFEKGFIRLGTGMMDDKLASYKGRGSNQTSRLGSSVIPKLLLPKFSRPAMYSLNGFIPRPNIRRYTTTTSTTTSASITPSRPFITFKRGRKMDQNRLIKSSYYAKINDKVIKQLLNFFIMPNRSRLINFSFFHSHQLNYGQDLEEDLDLKSSGSTDRKNYVLSKRKGDLSEGKQVQSLHNGQSLPQKYKTRKGQPGKDYPVLTTIPKTKFECTEKHRNGGFYPDLETGCQVWHICQGFRKFSFLCPNGTVFNQKSGICDWWYNADCVDTKAEAFPVDLTESESASSAGKAVLINFERRKKVYSKYFKS